MRSRTLREGSVGLLILAGLVVFGLLVVWIRGLRLGARSYTFTVEFRDAGGMQVGSAVRYRGVVVGRVRAVQADSQAALVQVEIRPATLKIPENSIILTNQTGLIGEATIDILPPPSAPVEVATNPLARDCPESTIICAGDRIEGQVGATFNELIAATIKLADLFADEELFTNLKDLTRNTSDAAQEVARLADEVTVIAESVQGEVAPLIRSVGETTLRIGLAADQAGLSAAELNRLLVSNRLAITGSLDNLSRATTDIGYIVNRLTPLVADDTGIVQNLQVLSANAALASANAAAAAENLQDLTGAFATQENILLLQETLDSARATFQNVQKITSDLDELTGDPEIRDSLRELIEGLGNLVSSAEQLQEQTAIAQSFAPAEQALLAAQDAATQPPAAAAPTLPPSPSDAASPEPENKQFQTPEEVRRQILGRLSR